MKIWKSTIYRNFLWLLPLIFCFIFLFGVGQVKAEIFYDIEQHQNNGQFAREDFIGTNFTPTYHQISGVTLRNSNECYGTIAVHICYGNIDNNTEALNALANCVPAVNSILCSYGGVDNSTTTCAFDRTYEITLDEHYILFESYDTNNDEVWGRFIDSNVYSNGELFGTENDTGYYYSSYDLAFTTYFDSETPLAATSTVEIIDLNETPDRVDIIPGEFLVGDCLTGPCLKLENSFKYCYTDSPVECYAKYFINDWLSRNSDYMYFSYATSTDLFASYENVIEEDELVYFAHPPTRTSDMTETLCLNFIESSEPETILYKYCSQKFEWVNSEDLLPSWLSNPKISTTTLDRCECTPLGATSTWLESIGGGIKCASYWTMCQAFSPTTMAKNFLQIEMQKSKNQFPINIGYSIYETIDIVSSSTVDNSDVAINVPLKWYDKNTKQYEEVGTLLSTTTLQTGMGDTLYDFYYLWFSRFIYLCGFLYLLIRMLGIINPTGTAPSPISFFNGRQENYNDKKNNSNSREMSKSIRYIDHGKQKVNVRIIK